VVAAIWPDAQFICLYRHRMDVIASGVEACRRGLDSFGFEVYAPRYPGNSVAAVGACWADIAAKMIDFGKRFPDRTLRVRYEDLVTDSALRSAAYALPRPDSAERRGAAQSHGAVARSERSLANSARRPKKSMIVVDRVRYLRPINHDHAWTPRGRRFGVENPDYR
jgi:hypothetical protein